MMASASRRMEWLCFFSGVNGLLFKVYVSFFCQKVDRIQTEDGCADHAPCVERIGGAAYTAESSASFWRYIFAAHTGATKIYVRRKRGSDATFLIKLA